MKGENFALDGVDYAILNCLKQNARMTSSEIGKKINLSVSAVIERIKKLEKYEVIQGYTVSLNQSKMGNGLIAIMEVSLEHPKFYDGFAQMIQENPNIQSCYYRTGEFDFILTIYTDSADSLERIHRSVMNMEGIQATKTHFVLKVVKNDFNVIGEINNA
ncbi:MAG: Lrp/AsnC family transcriptional regulator [Clostridia bacterium]|nr:Lrp/AsnC family transcriptional regulator [Clostridia bacterium]